MYLAYKDDLGSALEHLRAFWQNDCIDRPGMIVTARREKPLPGPEAPPPPAQAERHRMDPDYHIAAVDAELRSTYYAGEAIPRFWPDTGPGCLGALFGSEPLFPAPPAGRGPLARYESTVWFQPVAADWRRYDIHADPANPHWQATLRLVEAGQAALEGKALVGMTDLGGASDVLPKLRGTLELLADMTDPDLRPVIERARDRIREQWQVCYSQIHELVKGPELGSIDWLGIWGPGKMATLQSDMSLMISPAMFDWFVVPELEALCEFLDQTIFHVDTPAEPVHLDRLLAIPGLKAIQWGAGLEGVASDWIPWLQRVQRAGKGLLVGDAPSSVERLVRELRPEGLLIATSTRSEQEARDLVRLAKQWSKVR